MLNVTAIGSAGQAQSYFEQDNYYSQDQGYEKSHWGGEGSEILGLQGNVKAEEFKELLEGRVGGQELGKFQIGKESGEIGREHRPGWDLTFSAPKSVSIFAEVGRDNRLKAAHEAAVQKAMGYIEQEGAFTRVNGEREQTGNLVWAAFSHDTSRALDPQTHTHVVVMNATSSHTADGWRSLSNEQLFKLQKSADAIYQNELARASKELGYQVEWNGRSFEIGGVTRDQIETFSKRSEQIKEALADRGLTRGTASAATREMAALDTRDSKQSVDRDVLRAVWRKESLDVGINLEESIQRTKDPEAKPLVEKINPDIAVNKAIAHLGEREHVFEKRDLVEWANRFSEGRTGSEQIQRAISVALGESKLIEANGRWTTPEAVRAELRTLDLVEAGRGQQQPLANQDKVSRLVTRWEKSAGRDLNDGQRAAAVATLSSTDRVIGIQGDAGVGKTTMLSAVKYAADRLNAQVIGIAPTTEAAKVMGGELGIRTHTVAKFLADHNPERAVAEQQRLITTIDRSLGVMESQHTKAWDRLARHEQRTADRISKGTSRPDFIGGQIGHAKDGTMLVNTIDGWRKADLGDVFVASGVKAAEKLAQIGKDVARTVYEAAKAEIGRAVEAYKQAQERSRLEGFRDRAMNATSTQERHGVERDLLKYQVGKLEKAADGMREKAWNTNPSEPMREAMKAAHGNLMEKVGAIKERIGELSKELEGAKTNRVLVVDEASLLSSRDANRVIETAQREGMRVVFQGDVRQLQAVNAGKAFETAQQFGTEFSKAQMKDIQRQTTDLGKAVVTDVYRNDLKSAYEKLEAGGKVTVGQSADEAIKMLAKDLAGGTRDQREQSLVMTASRQDRDVINQTVREAYKQSGDVAKEGVKVETWRSRGLTEAQSTQAGQYSKGDGVEFGVGNKALGISAGEHGQIVSRNTSENTLTVRLGNGRDVQIDPKSVRGMESFERRQIEVAIGDKVRFTKNDKGTERTNGEIGHIRELKGATATVEFRGADGKSNYTATVDLNNTRHIDHGYAMTVHSSQGKTVEKENVSAVYINPDNPNKAMGQRSFLVAATRGKDAPSVYTNPSRTQRLQEQGDAKSQASAVVKEVLRTQDKTSAVQSLGIEKARDLVQNKGQSPNKEQRQERVTDARKQGDRQDRQPKQQQRQESNPKAKPSEQPQGKENYMRERGVEAAKAVVRSYSTSPSASLDPANVSRSQGNDGKPAQAIGPTGKQHDSGGRSENVTGNQGRVADKQINSVDSTRGGASQKQEISRSSSSGRGR